MGHWDRNNYLAVIKVRDNITDPVYMDYCIRTDMDFTIKEYQSFQREHPDSSHPVAVKVMDFICNYKGGRMRPDRWDWGEPLKRVFDDDAPQLLITYITHPGGLGSIRKNRLYCADFDNEWYMPIWEDKKPITISRSKNVLPEYMFSMTFLFSKSLKNIYPFIEEFVVDFCNALQTDYGVIIDQSNQEVLFDISNNK